MTLLILLLIKKKKKSYLNRQKNKIFINMINGFISKSKLKHGDKYNYSLVNYINNKTKVKIICPTHGDFEQRADKHLQGHGCRKCAIDLRKVKHKKDDNQFILDANLK